ncbi:MAG: RidA family protein [Rhodospirillales bacterium]|nr:RidA family protein [Rhodospirillales bacterium]
MITRHSPTTVAPPSSDYTHGVKVTEAETWMHVSGQIGIRSDGTLAGGSAEQMEVSWQRIFAILEDAEMSKDNIVKVTAFLTKAEDVGLYREVRDRMLEGHICASTLLIVSGLADPEWTVEIEAIAAK